MKTRTIHPRTVTTALRKGRLHEPFFCSRYSFSPYQGCGHGCLYCDGRAEKYYVEGVFDSDIVARGNLPDVLAKELSNLRELGTVSIGSGVSDVYQPVEADLELTRRCAEVLCATRLPVVLATKSSLVERDLDLWSDIANGPGFTLLMTIVTTNSELAADVEPGASSIGERFETLRRFKQAGATTGILAMPILPGLSDSESEIAGLYRAAASAGVDCVIPGNLTLRPGRQKDLFLRYVSARHPDLVDQYRTLYEEERRSGNTVVSYRRALYPVFARLSGEVGIPAQIPHRAFTGRIPAPDELYLLLCHMTELYDNADRLHASLERYASWLDEKRRYFNRRRSLHAEWVTEELYTDLATEDSDGRLFGNRKLLRFVRNVLDGGVFDYASKQLLLPEGTHVADRRVTR